VASVPSAASGDEERRNITGRATVVAAGTLLSRVLGLARESVFAAVFSRAATDAFFVAFLIPNVLRQLLAEGAVQSSVLPVLAHTREKKGEEAARDLFRALRGFSLLVLVLVSVAGIAAAPLLVELFAGGFRQHPGQYERTVELTRWMFPYIFFMGTFSLGVAALNLERRFVATSFAPALLNVALIACAALLPGWLGARGQDRILAAAVGVLLGGALQVVAQWPSLRRIGYFELPRLELSHPGVREVLRRMAPVLVGLGVYYVDTVLARRFLSDLEIGAQSWFAWALRLCDFPQGIFVLALQTATLPSLALLFARGERDEAEKTFAYGMRLSLFVGLAATALFVALAEPIVIVLFQRGEFSAHDSHETARALIAQGLGIWTVAAVRQLVGVYYALGDTRTPVLVAALDLGAFVAIALGLRGPLGHVGISFAITGASAVQMLLLWAFLARKLDHLRLGEILGSGVRTLIAAVAGGAAAWAVSRAANPGQGAGELARLAPGLWGGVAFGGVFLFAAWLVRSEELRVLGQALARRRAR
jgi:putative peptidoglycan lipid II flippase